MVATDDVHNFKGRLKKERERVEAADIDDRDREAILQMLVEKDGQIAISSLEQYSQRTRKAAMVADVPLVDMDLGDYERLVYGLRHEEDLADTTVRNIENALCILLEDILDREWVDDVDRVQPAENTVEASDMLAPEDIKALVDACRHQRDVAFIEFLADTGARLSLVLSLRVRDVDLDGERATYQPNPNALGTKGAKTKPYPIIDSAAIVRGYLRDSHPRPDEPEAALFHKIQHFAGDIDEDDGAISPSAARRQLLRIADRAGVDKPVNPHNFRHTAITRMFREGYSRGQIQHRVQWSVDTEMWSKYVHLTADELNEDIFATAGVGDADSEASDPTRRECGQCREKLAPHHEYCPRCGEAATPSARERVNEFHDVGVEKLADADLTASERRFLSTALKVARADNSAVHAADPPSSDG